MSYIACAKSEYDCDVIISKFLRFSDLKRKNRYIVFKNYSIKLHFLQRNVHLKLYLGSKYLYMACFYNFSSYCIRT